MRFPSAHGKTKQVAGQFELVPCHAAKAIWKDRPEIRRVALYIDNAAAMYSLTKGSSNTRDSA